MHTDIGILLLVENNAYPMDFRVRREAQALQQAGYRVSVIAPRAPGQACTETLDGVKVFRFPAPPGGNGVVGYVLEFAYATLAMLLLSIWVCLRQRIHVVHAANPPDTLWVIGAVLKPFGKRFVFDHHDLAPEVYLSRFSSPRENLVSRTLRWMERCTYAVADVVIATNESYRRRALETGGKHPDRVFVVRNGPPLSYQPLPLDPAKAQRPGRRIGYIGTIGPQDGLDVWMRVMAHLVHDLKRHDILAVVIGDGDALPEVRALARSLNIEPWVEFTGRLGEIDSRRHLSAVELCVQPDPLSPLNDKSTMNKLMEYMALGKPTVAFDLVETRFSAQGAAFYAHPNDEKEFARLVVELLDDPKRRRQMGEIGHQRVRQQLAWEHSVPHLLSAYRDGLGLSSTASRPVTSTDQTAL